MGQEVRALIEPFVTQLSRHSHLRQTDKEALLSLSGRAERVRVHREALTLGEASQHVMLVVSGYLGKFHETRSGTRAIVNLFVPGDIANLHTILSVDADSGVLALCEASIVRLHKNDLAELSAVSAPIAQALWRECAAESARSSRWLLNLGRRSALATIGHLFCEVACRTQQTTEIENALVPFPVTQADIADMAGCSLVHVNRTLRALRERGLITVNGTGFRILDWPALVAAADFDPDYLVLDARLRRAA